MSEQHTVRVWSEKKRGSKEGVGEKWQAKDKGMRRDERVGKGRQGKGREQGGKGRKERRRRGGPTCVGLREREG